MALTLFDMMTSEKFEFTSNFTKIKDSICNIVSDFIGDEISAVIKTRIVSTSQSLSTRIKQIKKVKDVFICKEVNWLKGRILLNETEVFKVRFYCII